MKLRKLGLTIAAVLLAGLAVQRATRTPANAPVTVHSILPTESSAKMILNTTHRHREWVNLPVGPAVVRAFLVYPERSDRAPVVVVTAKNQGASDWVRAVGDQIAADGFIAAVPDVLSGMGPNGGDTESFSSAAAVVSAIGRMSRDEIARRTDAVRSYAAALPAASGQSVVIELSAGDSRIQTAFDKLPASFRLGGHTGSMAIPAMPSEDHSAHIVMAMAQQPPAAQQSGQGGPRGYPAGKLPELPAGLFNATSTLLHSKLRREFVDLLVGTVKVHTWVEYPEGDGKAPVVIVMQHGPGLDDWQRALADQLALQGFIAVAADLYSGLGPNGGNWDSFEGTDAAMRAAAKLTPEEAIRRYKAAYDYGAKLARANGKVASLGFCAGGTYSFRFAAEVPALNAAVVFYGTQPTPEIMAKIKAPVLGFYGDDDARVTSTVDPTVSAMKGLGKSYEPHIYPHGTHGFLEYQDVGGNPAAAADSWARTIAFLREHLK